ncbi:autotransporter outer membrane beta-barrel domain-containing protein [Pseudomonas caspiana]|uniref:autotransporter outer membrane beta-barrel domain-containing protein n=1 Tax=Pseudomonas caspiana TaxID=1451454 RepID=UPI0032EBFDF0
MNARPVFLKKSLLCAAILATASSVDNTWATPVNPGDTKIIDSGTAVDSWELDNATIIVNQGGRARQISATWGSKVEITGGTVSAIPGNSGVRLTDSEALIKNSIIRGSNSSSNASQKSYGISLEGRDPTLGGGPGSKATVIDSEVFGVGRGINVTEGSTLILENTQVTGRDGLDPNGPIAGGVGIALIGSTAHVNAGSVVTGYNNGVVITGDKIGAFPEKATFNLNASHVDGVNGSAILVSQVYTQGTEATINIDNGSTLTGGNGIILEVEKSAVANFNVNNSRLVGDVVVEAGSTANLDLKNNASLTGTITNATSLIIDNSSQWVMKDDSSVGKLNLNGGTVDLRGTDGGASFHQLDVEELSGSGTFGLGTDLTAGVGDSLNVSGTATGDHKLMIENTGASPTFGGADLRLVHIEDGDAQFAVASDDGLVDTGTYAYALEQRADGAGGNDWFLVQTSGLSKSSEVAIGLFSAAPTVWYSESASLRSRMGELRTDSNQGGGWMRTYGNKYNMSAAGGVQYSQQQQGISFGADMPVSNSSGQWLTGLMGGYSKSDLDLKAGNKGKVDSYYIGAYSTWLADNGFYIDALIKANRFKNSADVTMRDGVKTKGDYTNHGIGGSVEVGKHITFADDWFVEPYAQVSALWVSGKDYTLDNGLDASSNQADSLLGKLGSHIGRKFALKDGGFVQPYVKAAVAREFVTSNEVTINDTRLANDLSGTRLEVGAGIAAQLTDLLQVHADFDYMKGSNIEQPWGINLGTLYNW